LRNLCARHLIETKESPMTRPDYTDISFVLDRSGSMESVKGPTVAAFNQFLASQREAPGHARMTLVQFDDQYEIVYRGIPLAETVELTMQTFTPRGSTALLDAIGRTIIDSGARFASLAEHDRPGVVLFVIQTDGHENASREFTMDRINAMIAEQRDKYAWQFVFLGANQDAIATASAMNIGAAQALAYSAHAKGTAGAFDALGKKAALMRQKRSAGDRSYELQFDEDDRKQAKGE
jgi:hypothetical protein